MYTPQYLYVRKDKETGQIAEVQTLEKIIDGDKFIRHIASLSGLPGFKERISMRNLKILTEHQSLKSLADDYDFDADVADEQEWNI